MQTTYKLGVHTVRFDKTEKKKLQAALDVLLGLEKFEGEALMPAIDIVQCVIEGIAENGIYVPGNLDAIDEEVWTDEQEHEYLSQKPKSTELDSDDPATAPE